MAFILPVVEPAVRSLLPLVEEGTDLFAVQTVGGLTGCQACLVIQTLPLSKLVTHNSKEIYTAFSLS